MGLTPPTDASQPGVLKLSTLIGIAVRAHIRRFTRMLVLSRKQSEEIKIGDDITLTIVRIGPNAVRLGVTAPKEVSIVRTEIIESGLDIQSEDESDD